VKPDVEILLVDDQFDYLTSIKVLLESEGFQPVAVSTGNEALSKAKQTDFDLIVVDIQIPDMDGIELCRQIRGLSKRTTMVIHTAFAHEKDRQDGYDAGVTMCVDKPEGFDAILEVAKAMRNSAHLNGTESAAKPRSFYGK